jgi:L-gulonate 5-dehydrogenase
MLVANTIAPKKTVMEERPEPKVGRDKIQVRVHYVAVCGTDVHVWDDSYVTTLPVVQGHEFSGVVEAIGEDVVTDLTVGQPVCVNPTSTCGECYACRIGRYNCCTSLKCIGCWPGKAGEGVSTDAPGGMRELVDMPPKQVFALPEGLPLDIAALGEPMGVATQAVNRGTPTAGETALVIGAGPIGALATIALKDRGVHVVVADVDANRAKAGLEFGADDYIVSGADFPTDRDMAKLNALAGPDGVVLAIEATGVPSCGAAAVKIVSPAGRVVAVGISQGAMPVPIPLLTLKELTILGSRNHHGIPEALETLNRHQAEVRKLITHFFDIQQVNEAYSMIAAHREPVGKVVFRMPAAQQK